MEYSVPTKAVLDEDEVNVKAEVEDVVRRRMDRARVSLIVVIIDVDCGSLGDE